MLDLLLAKPDLPPGFIDVSIGEPYLVRRNLIEIFQFQEELKLGHLSESNLDYPSPVGYAPLVKHLEDKYQAPIVITNGAKQALAACFYALKKMGKSNVGMRLPYWALIPPLASLYGLEPKYIDSTLPENYTSPLSYESLLLIDPNNPDGWSVNADLLKKLSQYHKDENIPIIHDAAYFSHIYLSEKHSLPSFGDVQVYSISKMLGLSGLRVGFAVCHNPEFYKLIQEYVEATTVGVSISSQTVLFDLLDRRMRSYPTLVQEFENTSALQLEENKKLCLQIDPEVLEIPSDLLNISGMFLWAKVGPKADFIKSKINVIDGALFGVPGYVRMNLAFDKSIMQEIVKRLNSVKKDINEDLVASII